MTDDLALFLTLMIIAIALVSFAFGWLGRGQTIDLGPDDEELLDDALTAVRSGETIRISR